MTTLGFISLEASSLRLRLRRGLAAARNARRLGARPRIVQSRVVRIAIGADHAGFLLKEHLKLTLQRVGHVVDDHGTHGEAPVDYPPICISVARAVVNGHADRGIVL